MKNVIFDFNQVLKKSSTEVGFIHISQLTDISNVSRNKQALLSDLFLNQQLIEWAKHHQSQCHFYIWSASNPKTLQLIKELFSPLFANVFSTHETGLHKSDVTSYQVLTQKVGSQASECLLIDDQLYNTEAAKKAGWQAIHFISTSDCLRQLDIILG